MTKVWRLIPKEALPKDENTITEEPLQEEQNIPPTRWRVRDGTNQQSKPARWHAKTKDVETIPEVAVTTETNVLSTQEFPKDELLNKFEALRQDYLAYKSRLNTQLATLGGGGTYSIMDMQDVDYRGWNTLRDGDTLVYDSTLGTLGKFKTVQTSLNESTIPIFIQNTAPNTTADEYLWVQTSIDGDANTFTFWIENGV